MKRSLIRALVAAFNFIVVIASSVAAKDPADSLKIRSQRLSKTTGSPTYGLLNINNLTSWMRYDGHSNQSPSGDDGVYYPRGTGTVIYQDCLVWGGKVFTDAALTSPGPVHVVRVGGGAYGIGTKAGSILGSGSSGLREDPLNSNVRTYRIRRNYFFMTEIEARRDAASVYEVAEYSVLDKWITAVKTQYALDWAQWPVAKGAPFIDRNGNGAYDPPPPFSDSFTPDSLLLGMYDEPGISGPNSSAPADQVLFTVYNDLDVTQSMSFAGSEPMGIEVQKTMWGYQKISGLTEMYFTRYRMINKGGVDTSALAGDQRGSFWIDSMYVAQWSDPDLGDAGDDVVGCDSMLNMGFLYNAGEFDQEFRSFSVPPPAVGYDYLAGPAVNSSGDSSIFNFRRRLGSKNLPMTSFGFYGSGDPYGSPQTGTSSYNAGTGRWWKLLRGYASLGDINSADQFYTTPPGVPPTFFPLSGDPVEGTGWLDGEGKPWSFAPRDNRIFMSSGPFRFAPGDTQEIYLALVVGLGPDRLSSVFAMKAHDAFAQKMSSGLFSLPMSPISQKVKTAALNGEIIFDWGSQLNHIPLTEGAAQNGMMRFEGYEVYELPEATSTLAEGIRVATYDIANNVGDVIEWNFDSELGVLNPTLLHRGINSGIRRWYRTTKSFLNNSTGTPLRNGNEYHFALTAYSVNANDGDWPVSLTSTPVVYTVKPQIPFGVQTSVSFGDTIANDHTAGTSTARILPVVIDPLSGTGDRYRISFDGSPDSLKWSISNITSGSVVISGQSNFSGNEDYPLVAGVIVKVIADSADLLSVGDVYEFSSTGSAKSTAAVEASVKRIGVYPNPYYGDREQVSNRLEQSVTFTNLPERAIIRIFNLAGHLVRTIHKDDPSQFIKWDLKNEYERYVGSGMFICHVELPDLGRSKVLKAAIIVGERIAQPQ